jgi:hypothetical protein
MSQLQDPSRLVETLGVSNVDFFAAPGVGTTLATDRTPSPGPARRRSILLVAGLVAVAVSLVTGFVLLRPHPHDDRRVLLPDTLVGLQAAETGLQFAQSGDWSTQLAKTFGDHPFDGRAFGGVGPGPLVNLVVVRTDSRSEADPGLGRPPYTKIGHVSCTNTFQLPDGKVPGDDHPKPLRIERMLLCWRARETLTVSVLVTVSLPGYEQTAARAVDEVWALEQ